MTDQSPSREAKARVERVETVPIDHPFSDEETPPIWRVIVGDYCADFDFEQAARNFAGAINADATRPQVSDGYQQAFYAIGDLLALNADVRSPKEVWEREMLPRLRELIALKQRTQPSQATPDAQALREARRFAATVKQELVERAPAYGIASIEREHFDRAILAINGLLRPVLTAPHPIARADGEVE